MGPIFHIALEADWRAACDRGSYEVSTRGLSLIDVGFIYASTATQVIGVANRYYRDAGELVLLVINPDALAAEVRHELVGDAPEPFPHIYGPLNLDAVVEVRRFGPGPDGGFHEGPEEAGREGP